MCVGNEPDEDVSKPYFNHIRFFRAVNMITRHFGSVTSSTVKNMDVERFPVIALIYRLRGTTEIFQVGVFFMPPTTPCVFAMTSIALFFNHLRYAISVKGRVEMAAVTYKQLKLLSKHHLPSCCCPY